MANWRKIKNIINRSDALGHKIVEFTSCNAIYYKFKCSTCSKILWIREQHIPFSTGKCKKHANQRKPFEAVYGGLKRGAKHRGIRCSLSYRQYLNFTNKNCFYCDEEIPWNPYNKHGQNNPGYFLDRMNPKKGYTKNNCVSCCTKCNMAKRSLTSNEFISMCKKIAYNKNV